MSVFVLIQRSEMVPGAARHVRIGGGESVPRYVATEVLGPYQTSEEAIEQTTGARTTGDVLKSVLIIGTLL